MDISNIAAKTASMLSQQKVGDAVGTTVQKKALNIQAQAAGALIESVSKSSPSSGNLPPHLGQNINVKA